MKTAAVLTFLLWAVMTLAGPLHQLHERSDDPLQPVDSSDSGDGASSTKGQRSAIFNKCMANCRRMFKSQPGFTWSSWGVHCKQNICTTAMYRNPDGIPHSAQPPSRRNTFGPVNLFRSLGSDMIGSPWLRYFKPTSEDQIPVNGYRLQPGPLGKPGLIRM
ncbi:MAG: hypothetical protein M1815_000182 [Lichina confinis]|nr:MAG: hypothetical protein M1815_000182 [Lichina confinis]